MDIGPLAGALYTQAAMGQLLIKVLDQTQALIQQQATLLIEDAAVKPSVEGLGENLDITA